MRIVPLQEHELLVFWVELVTLVGVAKALGALMRRIGQPAVIGELAAGVVLGPSVFARIWPAGARWLFPPSATQSGLIQIAGWIGIVMLLTVTGFDTDLALIRQLGRAATFVAGMSVALPFLLGLGLGSVMPSGYVGGQGGRLVFSLFLAAALSISSLPVIGKILNEMGLTRRNFGQLTLAAGMANDVVGWLLLGAIAGIARSGSVQLDKLALTVLGMAAFLAFAFTAGQRIVDAALRRVRERHGGVSGAFGVTVVAAFVAAAITEALGVEAVLGAFVAGIILGRSKYQDLRVLDHLETAALSVFAPLFFATAGLRMDLGLIANGGALWWTVVVLAIASIGKFGGAYVGGVLARLPAKEGLALGVGLNARGALEIVIATVGLTLGVLNARIYTVIVLMAIATSIAAPPLLRILARGWAGTPEEQERLQREESMSHNILVRPSRFLIPVAGGDGPALAAKILDLAWPEGQEATVVALRPTGEALMERVAGLIERRPVARETVDGDDAVSAVLEHTALGYGIVGMGAWQGERGDGLLSALTEGVLSRTQLPVLVVWPGPRAKVERVAGFRRLLVPVLATAPSRAAQELAFSLAATTGAEAIITHITTPRQPVAAGRSGATPGRSGGTPGRSGATPGRSGATPGRSGATATTTEQSGRRAASAIVTSSSQMARRMGIRPRAVVRLAESRREEITRLVRQHDIDLVVLSSELQQIGAEVYLGSLVEDLIASAGTTVAMLAAPGDWLAPA